MDSGTEMDVENPTENVNNEETTKSTNDQKPHGECNGNGKKSPVIRLVPMVKLLKMKPEDIQNTSNADAICVNSDSDSDQKKQNARNNSIVVISSDDESDYFETPPKSKLNRIHKKQINSSSSDSDQPLSFKKNSPKTKTSHDKQNGTAKRDKSAKDKRRILGSSSESEFESRSPNVDSTKKSDAEAEEEIEEKREEKKEEEQGESSNDNRKSTDNSAETAQTIDIRTSSAINIDDFNKVKVHLKRLPRDLNEVLKKHKSLNKILDHRQRVLVSRKSNKKVMSTFIT